MKINLDMKLHVPTSGEVGNYYIAHERGAHMYRLSPRMHSLLGNESTCNRHQYTASIVHCFGSVVAKLSEYAQSS